MTQKNPQKNNNNVSCIYVGHTVYTYIHIHINSVPGDQLIDACRLQFWSKVSSEAALEDNTASKQTHAYIC